MSDALPDPFTPALFLNPAYQALAGARTVLENPSTLEPVGVFGAPTGPEIDAVLERVNAAQKGWAATDPKARAKVLHRVADAIEAGDMAAVAKRMTLETGKPYPEAIGEIANIAPVFRYYAEMARDDAGHIAGPMQPGSFQFMVQEPLGVTVHVVPYNFPLILGCWSIAASLAAGNGVVMKAAPAGTLCALAFAQVFRALPDDLVAVLPGGAEVGQHLIGSPLTHGVAFTGSVASGKAVAVAAAGQLKPAVIEAGGSDPMIVSDKVDVDVAAAGAVTAAFLQSGQVCTSTERIYVVESAYAAFLAALVTRTRTLRIGDGMGKAEIGPLVSRAARDKVARLVEEAVAQGATVACGGCVPEGVGPGWFYAPTVLTGVTEAMEIAREEIFGPVVCVYPVPDFDTALARANDSDFGLGASLFTDDLDEAFRGVREMQAGMVWINNPLVDNDALPFGGIKNSGLGRTLGRTGLDAFRRPKMAVIDPKARMADWWYPYPDDWFHAEDESAGRRHV